MTRKEFAEEVLERTVGAHRRGATKALLVLMYAESGARPCDGRPGNGAHNNPLNTTLRMPGSTSFNWVGVQNYPTLEEGIEATIETLLEEPYDELRAVLASRATAKQCIETFTGTPWGTVHDLARAVLSDYNRAAVAQLTFWPHPYATVTVGP